MITRNILAFSVCLLACLSAAAQSSNTCGADPSVQGNMINTAAGVTGNYAGSTFLTITVLNMPTFSAAIPSIPPGGLLSANRLGAVNVLINGEFAYVFAYTPQQVLVLLPRVLPGCLTLYVEANGIIQYQTPFYANATAPGLFTYGDGVTVIASHPDWSLVTPTSPAHSGEWISLWAAGLGLTGPGFEDGQVPVGASQLVDLANFSVLLNGQAVDSSRIGYAGVAPGFAGLYQINILLPPNTPPNPEIRLKTADNMSPPQRFLAVQ